MAADVIDVSQLPAPDAIKDLSYEDILAARKASLLARFTAAGIDYDVSTLETDPGIILQEEDAFRELLDKAAINDAVRAVLAPYAKGTNLDAVVARANIQRLTVTPADLIAGTAAVMESDFALLQRYLDSFSRPAAGSPPSLRTRVRKAWPAVRDIGVYKTVAGGGPIVNIVLLAENGLAVPSDALQAVQLAMEDEEAAPTTMVIAVYAATIVPWTYAAELEVMRGPAPDLVRGLAVQAQQAFALKRYRLGGAVPANAACAPLYVPNVTKVTPSIPFADIVGAPNAAPWLASTTITTRQAN